MPEAPDASTWLALGDSYTIGEGVAEAERWPNQVAAALAGEGVVVAPRILATTGWTSAELLAALDRAQVNGPFDLVSLLIGVNDQYRGRALAEYRADLETLLERALGLAGGRTSRVLIASIPDWSVTPFARAGGHDPVRIAAQIDAFNAVAREAATARRLTWIDVTGLSRDRGADPTMLAADGLHPSAVMYARWSRRIAPVS